MSNPGEESTESESQAAGTEVHLTYFRFGGKWYGEGMHRSSLNSEEPWKIEEEVREMLKTGHLPGLVEGAREYIVLCEIRRAAGDFGAPRLIYLPALRTILLGAEELLG